jgi:hypothetical protein
VVVVSMVISGHSCVLTGILMCARVWLFLPTTVQRTISRALRWPLRRLPGCDTCDMSQHVRDLLTCDLCI